MWEKERGKRREDTYVKGTGGESRRLGVSPLHHIKIERDPRLKDVE